MITSARSGWPSDIALRDWQEAGLDIPCKVRLKLFTLNGHLILRRLGALSKRDAKKVKDRISLVLAIA